MVQQCTPSGRAAAALLLLLGAATVGVAAWAQEAVSVAAPATDVSLSGSSVQTTTPVSGDFFAAGGRVGVLHDVARDALLAAGQVHVQARVGGDLHAAGGQVSLTGEVAGDAMLAGGNVEILADAHVNGRAWLAGGNIVFAGRAGRDVKAYGGRVTVSGEVASDLRVVAEELVLAPGAVVRGDLHYVSRVPVRIDPQARVLGRIERGAAAELPPRRSPSVRQDRHWGIAWGWLGLAAAGCLWLLLFPRTSAGVRGRLTGAPWKALGIGTGVLLAAPPLCVLLVLTIVGIPVAMLLLAALALLMLLGYLTTADVVAVKALQALPGSGDALSSGRHVLALLLALAMLALLGTLPVLGPLLLLMALLAGVGALVMQWLGRRDAAPGTPSAGVPPIAMPADPQRA